MQKLPFSESTQSNNYVIFEWSLIDRIAGMYEDLSPPKHFTFRRPWKITQLRQGRLSLTCLILDQGLSDKVNLAKSKSINNTNICVRTLPAEMFGGSDFWLETRVNIKILKKMIPHIKPKVFFIKKNKKKRKKSKLKKTDRNGQLKKT